MEGQAHPGMIYRHLRQLEEDGLVISEWETSGTGPARRMYALTDDGREVLGLWIDYMQTMAEKLKNFIGIYHRLNEETYRFPEK